MSTVLYLTFAPPSDFSGGGIVIKQSLLSLLENYDVDYIGPQFDDEFLINHINVIATLTQEINLFHRVFNLFKGITTSFYSSWINACKFIEWKKYYAVYGEFTKNDFIYRAVKKNNKKLIVRAHNVEFDYYKNVYYRRKKLSDYFLWKYVKKQEYNSVALVDKLVCLTEEDKNRFLEKYPDRIKESDIQVIPVCVKSTEYTHIRKLSENLVFLITGSLFYGPNADGAQWFIEKVWREMPAHYTLILAGAKPNDKLNELVSQYNNVILARDPEDISIYFKKTDVYIAPIFTGAGMKVKVAEAISWGLFTIGTTHAFIGYNIEHKESGFIANTAEEFRAGIDFFTKMSCFDRQKLEQNVLSLFKSKYSMSHSSDAILNILENI